MQPCSLLVVEKQTATVVDVCTLSWSECVTPTCSLPHVLSNSKIETPAKLNACNMAAQCLKHGRFHAAASPEALCLRYRLIYWQGSNNVFNYIFSCMRRMSFSPALPQLDFSWEVSGPALWSLGWGPPAQLERKEVPETWQRSCSSFPGGIVPSMSPDWQGSNIDFNCILFRKMTVCS